MGVGRVPEWLKVIIIVFVLEILIRFIEAMPDAVLAGLGLLAPLVKHGVLGFLRKIYGEGGANIDGAVAAANRVAKLMGGGGIDFVLGMGKGILTGIWDGVVGPIELVVGVIEGVVALAEWLDKAKDEMPEAIRSILGKVKSTTATVKGAFMPAVRSLFSEFGRNGQGVRHLQEHLRRHHRRRCVRGQRDRRSADGLHSEAGLRTQREAGWVAGTVILRWLWPCSPAARQPRSQQRKGRSRASFASSSRSISTWGRSSRRWLSSSVRSSGRSGRRCRS